MVEDGVELARERRRPRVGGRAHARHPAQGEAATRERKRPLGLSAVWGCLLYSGCLSPCNGIRERRAINEPLRGLGSRLEGAEAAYDLDALAGVQVAAAARIGRLAHASAERAARDGHSGSAKQTPKLKLVQNGASLLRASKCSYRSGHVGSNKTNVFLKQ